MRYFIGMNIALIMALISQTVLGSLTPHIHWLPCFVPIILVYFAINASTSHLLCFTLFGGLLLDFIIGQYYGFSPLIIGIIVFMIRTQKPFLEDTSIILIAICTFFSSFLFFILGPHLFPHCASLLVLAFQLKSPYHYLGSI